LEYRIKEYVGAGLKTRPKYETLGGLLSPPLHAGYSCQFSA